MEAPPVVSLGAAGDAGAAAGAPTATAAPWGRVSQRINGNQGLRAREPKTAQRLLPGRDVEATVGDRAPACAPWLRPMRRSTAAARTTRSPWSSPAGGGKGEEMKLPGKQKVAVEGFKWRQSSQWEPPT